MPRRKSSAATDAPKKRRGRPPKAASAAAPKSATKAGATSATTGAGTGARKAKPGGRAPASQTAPKFDGRRIPTSPATTRAIGAAERAIKILKEERAALASAEGSADDARSKARETGSRTHKTAAKKARQKADRVSTRVAKQRSAVREAKARVVELKAKDRLNARLHNVEQRLQQQATAANDRVTNKLERATAKFRAAEEARLLRTERKKAKVREQGAEKRRAKLQREYTEKLEAAKNSLVPKPRKPRKRRRKTAAA